MKKWMFTCLLVLMAADVFAVKKAKSCLIWDLQTETSVSDQRKAQLIKNADRIVEANRIRSVTNKQKSLTGDIHDYESMAIYYWQDPANPNGKYILKDGQRNPEYELYSTTELYALSDNMRDLGIAYYLTGDKKYAEYAIRQFKAWALDEKTYMKPNFEYGQVIPGSSYKKGNVGGMSEAYLMVDMIEMISLLKDNKMIDRKTDKALKAWFKEFAHWMTTSNIGKITHDVEDNIGIMYDIMLYRISAYVGDKKACKRIANEFTVNRLNKSIAEDGRMPQELKRATSMTYSIYNLKHILDFCQMLNRNGVDYYSENQQRLDAAINFIMYSIEHKDTYQYQEIGNWTSIEKNAKVEYDRIQTLKKK